MPVASAVSPGLALCFRSLLRVFMFAIVVLSLQTVFCRRIVLLYLKRRLISIRYYEGEKFENIPTKLCEFRKSIWLLSFTNALTLTFLSVFLGFLVHREKNIMFFYLIGLIIAVWNSVKDFRSRWIHPFLLDRA